MKDISDWLSEHIRGIIIGCLIAGLVWVASRLAWAHYVYVYRMISVVSIIMDGIGIADAFLFVVAVVNWFVRKLR